ncbi:trypsin-like peptidase domain-containing protein [Leptothermofonsia sichuanensis E412]|uniref:trypsin-like peptidase domain-containing protein n=1 Tax=Leptothermofonsia sichuanensis TaxID=2917832 RepID=UPI001CA6FFFB|nr:trypsin-like peptidase domain-containing protein [Leptothermofonsia sichuanensis]QZZ22557.1 trypsin-like peptidase domain-containing protein [Leptothermofonsia sichuanensis E412]
MIRHLTALLFTPALISAQVLIFQIAQVFENVPANASPNLSVVRAIAGCSGQYSYGNIEYSFTVGEVASGFFISPDGYIVTNSHILKSLSREGCKDYALRNLAERVTGRKNFETIPQRTKIDLTENVRFASDFEYFKRVILPTGDSFPFEIKKEGKPVAGNGQDMAVIKIQLANAPTVQFGDANALKPQDPVKAIGYPLNEETPSFFSRQSSDSSLVTSPLGKVAVTNGLLSYKTGTGNNTVWKVNASLPYGSSGGPLVNLKGEVIGLVTGKIQAPGNGLPSVVPGNNLVGFVKEFASSSRDYPTDRLYREGLQRFQQGDFQGAKTSFEKVKELFPYNAEIYLLIHESEQRLIQAKQQSQRQFLLMGAGLAGSSALAGYFLLKRKKQPRKPLPPLAFSQSPPGSSPPVENGNYRANFPVVPSGTPVEGTKRPLPPDPILFGHAKSTGAFVEGKNPPVIHPGMPVEPGGASSKGNRISIEPRSVPGERRSAPSEPQNTPVEHKGMPTEPARTPVEQRSIPIEPTTTPVQSKRAPSEPQSTPVEHKGMPLEPTRIPVEHKSIPLEPTRTPVEGRSTLIEPESMPVTGKRGSEASPTSFQPPSDTHISAGSISAETLVGTQPFIELINQDGQVKRFYLCRESHSLGRDRAWCDFNIPEHGWKVISRRHAVLVQEGNDYRIYNGDRKTPSTNGLLIDNTPITTEEGYLLQDGDEIQIGHDPRNQVILTYYNPGGRDSSL